MRPMLELDRHSRSAPQVIGAIMAAAQLPPSGRSVAFRFIDAAVARPGVLPEGLEVRRLYEGLPGRPSGGAGDRPQRSASNGRDGWQGIPSERRWAMEVLGLHPGLAIERDDVQQRFRRLVRLAHPDHGAGKCGRGRAHRRAGRGAGAAAGRDRFGR